MRKAADAYMFNADLQYAAPNLKPENQSLCRRTARTIHLAVSQRCSLAQEIMHDVTAGTRQAVGSGRFQTTARFHPHRIEHGEVLAASASWPPPREEAVPGPAQAARREPGYGQIRESVRQRCARSHAARHLWMEKARRRRHERTASKLSPEEDILSGDLSSKRSDSTTCLAFARTIR